MKAWSGRFDKTTDALTDALNASISFDQRLYEEDIAGSVAHAPGEHGGVGDDGWTCLGQAWRDCCDRGGHEHLCHLRARRGRRERPVRCRSQRTPSSGRFFRQRLIA